jgi:hypothetical protein
MQHAVAATHTHAHKHSLSHTRARAHAHAHTGPHTRTQAATRAHARDERLQLRHLALMLVEPPPRLPRAAAPQGRACPGPQLRKARLARLVWSGTHAHAHAHTRTHLCRGLRVARNEPLFECAQPLLEPLRHARTHAHATAHTRIRTRMHARTHACTHAHVHTRTCKRMHARTHAQVHTHEPKHPSTCTSTRASAHTHTPTHPHTHTHTHPHTYMHARTRTLTLTKHPQTHPHDTLLLQPQRHAQRHGDAAADATDAPISAPRRAPSRLQAAARARPPGCSLRSVTSAPTRPAVRTGARTHARAARRSAAAQVLRIVTAPASGLRLATPPMRSGARNRAAVAGWIRARGRCYPWVVRGTHSAYQAVIKLRLRTKEHSRQVMHACDSASLANSSRSAPFSCRRRSHSCSEPCADGLGSSTGAWCALDERCSRLLSARSLGVASA